MDAIERQVTLPTDLDAAWELLTRPDDLAAWLGAEVEIDLATGAAGRVVEPDGTTRHLVVHDLDPGRRLAWHWWREDAPDDTSRVEITLVPVEGGTQVLVVEELVGVTATARGDGRRGVVAPPAPPRVAAPDRRRRPGVTRDHGADARAGAVFEALADGTRRAVLRDVATHGPRTATELAAELPISRQAVAKHLSVLREAGLVAHERSGREARFTATLGPLSDAEGWLRSTGASWDQRLARLQQHARGRDAPGGRE